MGVYQETVHDNMADPHAAERRHYAPGESDTADG